MDGPPPQEEDFSQLPIQERLAHKSWKARVSGYETLIKDFANSASDSDPVFKPYIHNPDVLKKIATDSNAVAQEKGVEVLVSFVKYCGEGAARTRDAVMPALVDKCFGSTRAGTKAHAIELALQYVEVENSANGVVADILPGLGAKQPKVVASCVTAFKEIFKSFGPQAVSPPPLLKALPKIFAHTDKTVRAEGTLLAQSLYQGIGPAIEPFLSDLKPVQVKELKESFEKLDADGAGKGTLKPARLTRAQAREVAAGGGEEEDADGADGEGQDQEALDPRQYVEEVDIVPKLPSGLQEALRSSKWKERKEVLDALSELLTSTPRIKDSPELVDVVKALAGRMSDANVMCVMAAAACLEHLAKGLMGSFARFREIVVPPILERLKERKQNVTDALGGALDAVFLTTTLPEIMNEIMPALSSKNPQVKEGTMKFLARCLSTTKVPPAQPQVKPLSEALAGLLEDQFEGARNEAAVCLGTLMKIVGERPLNAIMDQLADVRKVKVKEAFEKATVKCKAGAGAPPKPPAKAASSKKPGGKSAPATGSADALEDAVASPKGKAPARLMGKKPAAAKALAPAAEFEESPAPSKPAAKPPARSLQKKTPAAAAPPAAAAAAKGGKGAAPAHAAALDTFKFKHTPEDAEALWTDLIPTAMSTDFSDSNWKVRLAALDEMTAWVEGNVQELDSEVVVRFFAKKGFNEKNFQVLTKLYGILSILAEQCPSFGRSSVALAVPHLSEKLGDMKLKKPSGDTMLIFAEKTSLQFVLNQAYETLAKQKAPKVLADALVWVEGAITEFGVAGLNLRALIDFLKTALGNSNAGVRTNATKTLVSVKLFVGPGVKDLLGEINPQLLATITGEFDKVEGKDAPVPTRTSVDLANLPASGSGKAGAVVADPMDDLFPRIEIDGLLKGTTILADAKSDQWKTKKEALETLQAILDQGPNKRLKPSMGEIGQVLKARVTDTNKAVQLLALDIVGRIATGMGRPFEKQTRFFTVPVASVLADQKANIRNAATQTLTAIVEACEGVDSMVNNITTALEAQNPMQRSTLLNWLADWFKEHEPSSSLDLSAWAAPVIACLDDRNTDVRKGGQALLPFIVRQAGFDYVMQQTNSLKPASRSTVIPMVKAAAANLPASSSQTSQPEAPSKAAGKSAPASKAPSPPPEADAPSPTATEPPKSAGLASKLGGIRRKLPLGTATRPDSRASVNVDEAPAPPSKLGLKPATNGLKRPGAASTAPSSRASPASAASEPLPFTGMSLDQKKARLAKDNGRFAIESGPVRKDLAEYLQGQAEPVASRELLSLLFSHDHNAVNDHVAGLNVICDFYSNLTLEDNKYGLVLEDRQALGIANADIAFKYASLRIHEPQPNLISKCLEAIENITAFMREFNHQLSDLEALCFVPTIIHKLGDAREAVRLRVQQIIQTLPKVYAYSRIFQLLAEHGLKSKVAKTRQGTLDELAGILKRTGLSACDPPKVFPLLASMIADKDAQVRRAALSALGEAYTLVGDKIWSLVGRLSPKDKTQLEERLRRVAGPSQQPDPDTTLTEANVAEVSNPPTPAAAAASRFNAGTGRIGSPIPPRMAGGIPRPASPAGSTMSSKLRRPMSPSKIAGSSVETTEAVRSGSPAPKSKLPGPAGSRASPVPGARPKSMLPSRLARPESHIAAPPRPVVLSAPPAEPKYPEDRPVLRTLNGLHYGRQEPTSTPKDDDAVSLTISRILSSDPNRSVDALKQVQKILELGPDEGPSSQQYQELSDHIEGLVETVTLQMGHVFEDMHNLAEMENFRLAKHLIQTLNAFCDHSVLAESLPVGTLTGLLEELTLRLLQTDESSNNKVKDLSRFINMIILRLFSTCRRMVVVRALFTLLLQIVKPFPMNGTSPESREAKVAELVLKCIWKLARNIPTDLDKQELDPVELFPAIEHFLQSVPPNEWRARASNKVPSGDMPLRTIKVIIQHVVAHYGDEVYDLLASSFDDPSATIVYPYVYRILNTSRTNANAAAATAASSGAAHDDAPVVGSTRSSQPAQPDYRATSPTAMTSSSHARRQSIQSGITSTSGRSSVLNGTLTFNPPVNEPDPDDQLLTIINHISSETTGAMHKEGITELHHFLKAYPHKKPRVDRMLENTGPAFRKYIARALASRAAEDEERTVAVADTLSKLESNRRVSSPQSPRRSSGGTDVAPADQDKLNRLHDLFHYRSSTTSNGSATGREKHLPGTTEPLDEA